MRQKVQRRIITDIAWIIVLLAIVILIASCLLGLAIWSNIRLWIVSALSGLAVGERNWIRRWLMNIISCVKMLREQENNPKKFLWPYIEQIDFFPDPLEGIDLDYISITFSWVNTMCRQAEIKDIKGTISIDASRLCELTNVSNVISKPYEKLLNPQDIIVNITHDTLRIVKNMRANGCGKGSIRVKLSAKVNNIDVDYEIPQKYEWVT